MGKNYKKTINTFIRNFYGTDSFLMISFFNQNLSFRIGRYNNGGRTNGGFNRNDMGEGITATVNYEGAYYLYEVAMSIVNDINPENEKRAVLERGDTTILLEYVRDQNNRMSANLSIQKTNNRPLSYIFLSRTYNDKKNGQMITTFVQSELGAFAMTILGYLVGVGADRHLEKLPDD